VAKPAAARSGRPLPARLWPARRQALRRAQLRGHPRALFEAELFGHESGAFTGAQGKRIGKLEYANGGTVFLDEIESMPLAQQAKLLRVMQEQKLERLGANQSISVDLRIIAATKPDLLDEARAGRFREDLAYRLNVAELRLAPLRERREDIRCCSNTSPVQPPNAWAHRAAAVGSTAGATAVPRLAGQCA
jgi:two-component system C4-dicarboxylate transport response regulator DctD